MSSIHYLDDNGRPKEKSSVRDSSFKTQPALKSIQPVGFPPLPMDWVSEWDSFLSADGKLQLNSAFHHAKNWKHGKVLIVLHGLGEHGGRYLHFPHFMRNVVDGVYCPDHRGHGRSQGLRGHVDRFDLYREDAALAISRLYQSLKGRFEKPELHLLGHSMGGLIALRTLSQFGELPIQSATLSAPLLAIKAKVPWVKKTAGLLLKKVWGTLQLNTELDPKDLSHDPNVAIAYQKDRLVHKKVTSQFFSELHDAMADTLHQTTSLACPVSFLIPLQDRIVDSEVALHFFQFVKHHDKSLKTYPEFFHEPMNEIGKEAFFEDLCQWIQAHSQI